MSVCLPQPQKDWWIFRSLRQKKTEEWHFFFFHWCQTKQDLDECTVNNCSDIFNPSLCSVPCRSKSKQEWKKSCSRNRETVFVWHLHLHTADLIFICQPASQILIFTLISVGKLVQMSPEWEEDKRLGMKSEKSMKCFTNNTSRCQKTPLVGIVVLKVWKFVISR